MRDVTEVLLYTVQCILTSSIQHLNASAPSYSNKYNFGIQSLYKATSRFRLSVNSNACYALQAGYVYICDLRIMDGLPVKEGHHCAAPMCLLYVNGSNQLVPIAIQLNQQPGQANPIFLSTDNWIDWLLAKIYYQSAQTQVYSNCIQFRQLYS